MKLLLLDEPVREFTEETLIKKTAHDAITILINLSQDPIILTKLTDETFIKLLTSVILGTSGLADLSCMLLSNLAKSEKIKLLDVHTLEQLLEQYNGAYTHAKYDFLINLFSDLTRFPEYREWMVTRMSDLLVPHASQIRRTGTASVLKNCCFETKYHSKLLDEEGVNALLYIHTPLCGPNNDGLKEEEVEAMFDTLQFLEADKKREPDTFTVTILLDALLLLCTTREGRDHLRRRQTYPIIRQLHLDLHSIEDVSECCEKIVNMLMRDEESDDDQITEV